MSICRLSAQPFCRLTTLHDEYPFLYLFKILAIIRGVYFCVIFKIKESNKNFNIIK